MSLQYGYLRGTFGLPYGGYCIRPSHLHAIDLQPSNPHQQMFCILGPYHSVTSWLSHNPIPVLVEPPTQPTFTHELIVEVYTQSSYLSRMVWGLDSIYVQFVIRIGRVWDRGENKGSQFHPLLKMVAPSGVLLTEMCAKLKEAVPGQLLDATKDKELVDRAVARTASSDLHRVQTCLPPYEHRQLPPSYT
ncbi:hypothetical protein IW137_000268 [Coemansia sp. RSA 1287]|nr:hypothetical protein GGH17_001536 [Coemansia sp. RSA 788]KAJ2167086.1 hypothetical protein GGH15_002345 [Coemansia sp. RSA 562]KAJ2199904.1 hypothetical protein GGH18_000241 [Coemansia sp. RSA 530]KAJ2257359.1 hypothetical protein GGH98_000905 [Coemansia sp. RSA 454]KAJ2283818.1 hypothetical protein GGH14_000589 [Coemansia sp. RSA 370]KAJ2433371.1 hypothetical protein IWW41_002096 [Coemansia sp. RSA 2522]KAJ2652455.1 hypothetical protein IW137_000268 [Coemansia sp. RSA 1287]